MYKEKFKTLRGFVVFLIIFAWIFSGFPQIFNPSTLFRTGFPSGIQEARAQNWYNSNWSFRKAITISNAQVTADLTNFPVLVNLASDTDLTADAQNDGDDILFTSSDGTTKLDHEIEKFDGTTGELVAWVEVPSLTDATDTVLYMYYGNAGAVNQQNATGTWNVNFKGVWHLIESGDEIGNDYLDSTSNANALQGGGGDSTKVPIQSSSGLIDGAENFDGTNDLLNRASTASLEITGNITLSAWINITDSGTDQIIIAKPESDTSHVEPYFDYSINLSWASSTTYKPQLVTSSGNVARFCLSTDTINVSSWNYIVGAYDGTTMKTYVNGVEKCSSDVSGAIDNSAKKLFLGANGASGEVFKNLMDEARVSNTNRSADWILTEYNNQNSPSTFYTLGSEAKGIFGHVIIRGKVTIRGAYVKFR